MHGMRSDHVREILLYFWPVARDSTSRHKVTEFGFWEYKLLSLVGKSVSPKVTIPNQKMPGQVKGKQFHDS